ncbi:hypothetical protein NQ318_008927 [Aromia moschata]|uniref:Uncharacterized protein n=1 Tax=Aromia moschata TaxID=1265417 RepID=A0AAV8ZAX2_9CUCU|nr:hypothetical protein NQ318_008927 [Aromia moschata]
MDEETYLQLLSLVIPLIQKQDTVMRNSITPHERLSATLRFLATGRSYEDLKYSTLISPQALSCIIPETCEAIYRSNSGVKCPTSHYGMPHLRPVVVPYLQDHLGAIFPQDNARPHAVSNETQFMKSM